MRLESSVADIVCINICARDVGEASFVEPNERASGVTRDRLVECNTSVMNKLELAHTLTEATSSDFQTLFRPTSRYILVSIDKTNKLIDSEGFTTVVTRKKNRYKYNNTRETMQTNSKLQVPDFISYIYIFSYKEKYPGSRHTGPH